MHTLDIICVIIGVIFLVLGIKRGLIGEIIRLLALTIGIIVAFLYSNDVLHWTLIRKIALQNEVKHAIVFICIYLLCAVIIIAAGWIIKKVVHCTPLGWIDRLLGALIGVLKTAIIAYVACLSIATLPFQRVQNDFKNSIVYSIYRALPQSLSLKSMLKKRSTFRTMFRKESPGTITIPQKIEQFKAVVDSAKNAQGFSEGNIKG